MATHRMTTRRGIRRGGRWCGVDRWGGRAALAGGMLVGMALAVPQAPRQAVVAGPAIVVDAGHWHGTQRAWPSSSEKHEDAGHWHGTSSDTPIPASGHHAQTV